MFTDNQLPNVYIFIMSTDLADKLRVEIKKISELPHQNKTKKFVSKYQLQNFIH